MASPIVNMYYVWYALFLRQILDRFFGVRSAWVWLIVEPMIQVVSMAIIWSLVRGATMNGVDTVDWILVGILTFFIFRRTAVQTQHSVDCNKPFFAFRQVRPFDATIIRAGGEAFSMFFVATACVFLVGMFGHVLVPRDPVMALVIALGMWFIALGFGMVSAVCMRLVPETGHFFMMLMMPLYFMSGAIFPLSRIPPQFREYMLYNPLAHYVELMRICFFDNYHAMDVNLGYPLLWTFALLFCGLAMLKLNEKRLRER